MLKRRTEILPLFVVRWLALKYCEKFHWQDEVVHSPRPGVLIYNVEKYNAIHQTDNH